jgi:choline dehydrogenase
LNSLSHPDDLKAARESFLLARELHRTEPLRSLIKREIGPLDPKGEELNRFVRDSAATFWHTVGTAKMGRDHLSVVDANLAVYGISNLRIIDGSIFPRIPTGNTMAPCIVVGERGAEILQKQYGL